MVNCEYNTTIYIQWTDSCPAPLTAVLWLSTTTVLSIHTGTAFGLQLIPERRQTWSRKAHHCRETLESKQWTDFTNSTCCDLNLAASKQHTYSTADQINKLMLVDFSGKIFIITHFLRNGWKKWSVLKKKRRLKCQFTWHRRLEQCRNC